MLACHKGTDALPCCSASEPAPCLCSGKAIQGTSGPWARHTCRRTGKTLGSRLPIGPALPLQPFGEYTSSWKIFLYLCNSAFQKRKKKKDITLSEFLKLSTRKEVCKFSSTKRSCVFPTAALLVHHNTLQLKSQE